MSLMKGGQTKEKPVAELQILRTPQSSKKKQTNWLKRVTGEW